MERTQIANAALARSDRYLREFVEALRMCPFAKGCREDGRLHRQVLFEGDDVQHALQAIEPHVEVALFLFPLAAAGSLEAARAFEAFGRDVRERMPKPAAFYCVAFHPNLPRDLRDAHRAVPFVRRSPDPTLQFVRIATLDAVRGASGDRYVDPSKVTPELLASLHAEESLSDRIAADNLRTILREGPDELERALRTIAER